MPTALAEVSTATLETIVGGRTLANKIKSKVFGAMSCGGGLAYGAYNAITGGGPLYNMGGKPVSGVEYCTEAYKHTAAWHNSDKNHLIYDRHGNLLSEY